MKYFMVLVSENKETLSRLQDIMQQSGQPIKSGTFSESQWIQYSQIPNFMARLTNENLLGQYQAANYQPAYAKKSKASNLPQGINATSHLRLLPRSEHQAVSTNTLTQNTHTKGPQSPAVPWQGLMGQKPTPQAPEAAATKDGQGFFKKSPPMCSMNEVQAQAIYSALVESGGNVSKTAKILKLGRATLYRKVQQYGIEISDIRSWNRTSYKKAS